MARSKAVRVHLSVECVPHVSCTQSFAIATLTDPPHDRVRGLRLDCLVWGCLVCASAADARLQRHDMPHHLPPMAASSHTGSQGRTLTTTQGGGETEPTAQEMSVSFPICFTACQ